MATTLFRQLMTMVAGECRWIVREDLHVFAWGSRDDAGKYDPRRLTFKVVTADRPHGEQEWMAAASAVELIESLA